MADWMGQQLGNYRLIRLLGSGGAAEVYLGEHDLLHTQAAIKVLHGQLTSQEEENRFLGEARLLVHLKHPHIVPVLDFAIEKETGTPFLVMEFAARGTLRERYPRGRQVHLEQIIPYVKQAAAGLQCAHDRHIVHRDIKPGNLLLGPGEEVWISDFGIAVIEDKSRTWALAGTLSYMAPEQINERPVPASDQYSLGIVVYEWLSGAPPFQGTTATQIALGHLFATPPSLRERLPALSPAVEAVVMRALAKDPAQRFESVQAFARALEEAASGRAGAAPAPQLRVAAPSTQLPLPGTLVCAYRGHSDAVWALAWSPDGQRLASGSFDQSVHTWDVPSLGRIRVYRGHSGLVQVVRWSPDGRLIASGGSDKTVRVWDALSGQCLLTYRGHKRAVTCLDWSPDGQQIASGSEDHSVQVWEAASGNRLFTYRGHQDAVRTLGWSPNGQRIAAGSDDRTVQVWDVASGILLINYVGHSDWVNALAWSPDGRYLASASKDRTVQVWEAASGRRLIVYSGHRQGVGALAWSPDGGRIASGSWDGTVQVWEATSGRLLSTCAGQVVSPASSPEAEVVVAALAWSPNGRFIASAGSDMVVQVWQAP
jgi:serine/threonine protein kinase